MGVVGLVRHHPLAAIWLAVFLFLLGAVIGLVVIHPLASRFIIRRQTTVETVRYLVSVRFPSGGSHTPLEWTQDRTVRALVDGMEYFAIQYSYGDVSHRVDVECIEGGDCREQWHDESSGLRFCRVWFPRPLRKGEEHRFVIRLTVPPGAPPCPPFLTVTPTHLMSNVKFHITFAGAMPRACWSSYWVSSANPVFDGQMEIAKECRKEVLRPNSSGIVEDFRRHTKPGHRYGITWAWT